MNKLDRGWICVASLLIFFSFVTTAGAQTDPTMLTTPWQTHQAFDTSTDAVIESANPTRESHDLVQVSSYQAFGRWRVLPDQRATPTLGYDLTYFDIHSADPALPNHLWTGTFGFAQPVAEINKYFVVLTAAAGYAGDTPFSDPHAAFFTANVIVGRQFSRDNAIIIALNYDGNRTFFPDVPIPAIEYADRYNDHLTYVVGFPLNTISYTPLNGLQIDGGWALSQTFSGRIGYEFVKHFSVYGTYTDRLSGFHISTLPADRRLFFQEHRAEIGLRWNPTQLIRVSVGGGWAFGQEFSHGYDSTGLNPVRHLRDAPFGKVLLELGI